MTQAPPIWAVRSYKNERCIKMISIKEAREKAGVSRAEMARQFEIPYRTLENWENGVRTAPVWAEKLIVEKLETTVLQSKKEDTDK